MHPAGQAFCCFHGWDDGLVAFPERKEWLKKYDAMMDTERVLRPA